MKKDTPSFASVELGVVYLICFGKAHVNVEVCGRDVNDRINMSCWDQAWISWSYKQQELALFEELVEISRLHKTYFLDARASDLQRKFISLHHLR